MSEYSKGLKIEVTDRDEFKQFIIDNGHDWGDKSVPEALYIVYYQDDGDSPYYKTYDQNVNGVLTWNYWVEDILETAIASGILEITEKYNVALVEEQENE